MNTAWIAGFVILWTTVGDCANGRVRGESKGIRSRKNIPGIAGVDYPVFTIPPQTSFRCSNYDYTGFFADISSGCQVYHICFPDLRNSTFLCNNGTIFNQRYFVCDWWYRSNCSSSEDLYHLNRFRRQPLPVIGPPPPPIPPIVNEARLTKKVRQAPTKISTNNNRCYCPCNAPNSYY